MAGEKALAQELTTQTSAGAGVNARPALTSIASDLAQLKNMAVLLKTIRTGDYPVGMTAADLAAIEIRPGETALILPPSGGIIPEARPLRIWLASRHSRVKQCCMLQLLRAICLWGQPWTIW